MVPVVVVSMWRRLSVHVRGVCISMVSRIVLGWLVHARMHSSMQVHLGMHMGTVRIADMSLALLIIIIVIAFLLHWVHTIVFVSLTLVVLFFFHAQCLGQVTVIYVRMISTCN
jgi:hypothetical protein